MGFRDLIARLRRLPGTVEMVSTKVDLIEQQISDLRQLVERTNSSLTSDLKAGGTATTQRFDQLREALDAQHHSRKSMPAEVHQLLSGEIGGLSAAVADTRGTLGAAIADARATLGTSVAEARDTLGTAVADARGTLETAVGSAHGTLANSLNGTENLLLGRLSWLQGQIATLAEQLSSISAQNGEISNGVNAFHNATSLDIAELGAATAGRQGAMANELNRISNAIRSFVEAREVDAGLNMLMSRSTSALIARMQDNPATKAKPVLPPSVVMTLTEQMTALKKSAPANFPAWHAAYEAGVAEGLRTPEGNLSHEGHIGAGHFRMFVNVHARGRVLDVGCGPIALPSYLNDWPIEALAGMDPQLPLEPHAFPFAQSLAEWIPWPDHSFETVVIATSLDHVYLLDQALAEVKRVLVPGGRLLIWTALFDETPRYTPKGPKFTPPDSFHLFHPGRNWFYELFESDYRLIERMPAVANAELLAYELKTPHAN